MATTSSDKLDRVLGPWTATAIVVGTVIGSGVFKKPAQVATEVPTFGVAMAAWVIMAGLVICGGLALAEVTTLFPRAGGNYVFLREGFGRAFGFMWGWMDFFVIRTASIAALAMIFVESLHNMLQHASGDPKQVILGFWTLHALAQATIFALGIVNCLGVRWGGGLQLLLTIIKVGGIVFMILLPVGLVRLVEGAPTPSFENMQPLWTNPAKAFSLAAFGGVLITVLWPYHGWQNLGPVAGEVKNPQRNIPRALLGGIGGVALLYLGLNLAFASVIPFDEMATLKGTSVAAAFCGKLLGPIGASVAAGVVMCSVFGSLNGNILVGPRLLYAMGEDRLAPQGLSAIHPTYRTPARAIMVYTIWSMVLLLGGGLYVHISKSNLEARVTGGQLAAEIAPLIKRDPDAVQKLMTWPAPPSVGEVLKRLNVEFDKLPDENKKLLGRITTSVPDPFDLLTDFAMFGAVVFETLAVAAIFVFRRRLPNAERQYRCAGYPVVPAIYVLAFVGVLASYFLNDDKRMQAMTGTAFVLAGAAVYGLFLRTRNQG